jgi:uncharacterized delta-60 repeat protein
VDTGFDMTYGPNDVVNLAIPQSDGKVVIVGYFTVVKGTTLNRVARLSADGSVDTSFNFPVGPNADVLCAVVQPDGKILIGGFFTNVNGVARNRIARLNLDGGVDSGFDPGTGVSSGVFSMALQTNGQVVIGGGFTNVNGVARRRVARLNSNGSLDPSFNGCVAQFGGELVMKAA